MHTESGTQDRSLALALRRGLACKCPACGEARLFRKFLKPVETCPACGEHWAERRADDFPAYLVVLALGHIMVPLVVEANIYLDIPAMVQMIGWPLLAMLFAMMLIQPAKGFVLGLLWARQSVEYPQHISQPFRRIQQAFSEWRLMRSTRRPTAR